MKYKRFVNFRWRGTLLAIVILLTCLSAKGYCQTGEAVILIQQSPDNGGVVTPGIGVHHFGIGTEVTLNAIANPGYRFVYWLGDVGDTTSNRTVAYLDSPKIIIAVFERSEFEDELEDSELIASQPGGGLMRKAADYARGGGGGAGGRRPWKWPPRPPVEELDDFPVPGTGPGRTDEFPVPGTGPDDDFSVPGGDELPVPIPEPTTITLLSLGALVFLKKRRP